MGRASISLFLMVAALCSAVAWHGGSVEAARYVSPSKSALDFEVISPFRPIPKISVAFQIGRDAGDGASSQETDLWLAAEPLRGPRDEAPRAYVRVRTPYTLDFEPLDRPVLLAKSEDDQTWMEIEIDPKMAYRRPGLYEGAVYPMGYENEAVDLRVRVLPFAKLEVAANDARFAVDRPGVLVRGLQPVGSVTVHTNHDDWRLWVSLTPITGFGPAQDQGTSNASFPAEQVYARLEPACRLGWDLDRVGGRGTPPELPDDYVPLGVDQILMCDGETDPGQTMRLFLAIDTQNGWSGVLAGEYRGSVVFTLEEMK